MPTVRCDKCDAICSEAEVRDGWCGGCGKRLPAYLLHATTADETPPAAEEPPEAGEFVFRPARAPRMVATAVLFVAALVAGFAPVWIAIHPPENPRKNGEAVFAAVLCGTIATLALSVAVARARGAWLVVGDVELRHTHGFLDGLVPILVTDRIPFSAVERFGFTFTLEDTDPFITPGQIPTVMLRVARCPECPSGGDFRLVLKEYPDAARILKLLRFRIGRPPEPLLQGWLGLGRFR